MSHKRGLIGAAVLLVIASTLIWSSVRAASKASRDSAQQGVPNIAFDRAVFIVTEPDGRETETITLYVRISEAPAQGEEAMVTALSANANAVAGLDFEAVAAHLTFPAGSTTPQSFNVTIYGNDIDQPDRAFVVFLTNPTNALVYPPASITIQIMDNDPFPRCGELCSYLPLVRGFQAGPTPVADSSYPASP